MKREFLIAACCLLMTSVAFSQSDPGNPGTTNPKKIQSAPTTCPNDPVLSSDGTVTAEDSLQVGGTAYYALNAKAGHSYAIEVWDPFDLTAGVAPTITVTSDCTTSIMGVADVTHVDPDLGGGFASRVSWIQSSDQPLAIALANPDQTNGYTYYIRVTDTTLFNPRWSTIAGFNTSWGLVNTTNSDIVGVLTVFDQNGGVLKTYQGTFKAGLFTGLQAIQDLKVPAEHAGDATFAFIGPPGGILADAYFLNGPLTVIVPTQFAAKHAYH